MSNNKPKSVSTALTLLWISLGAGFLNNLISFSKSVDVVGGMGYGYLIFITLFSLAFTFFFIYMIGRGKNWARILFLVLFILGTPISIFAVIISIVINPLSAMFIAGISILNLIAIIFLFQKTSSEWFHSMKL